MLLMYYSQKWTFGDVALDQKIVEITIHLLATQQLPYIISQIFNCGKVLKVNHLYWETN